MSQSPHPMDKLRAASQDVSRLPEPDIDAQAHSEQLVKQIITEIEVAGGKISFDHFMAQALYTPGLGYYSAGSRKFGEAGDFVTAPEISPLFSRCLARQCREVLNGLGGGEVLEFGAGSGVMAADILAELEALGCLPERYAILEVSADLKARQKETIEAKVPHLLGRVEWLERLPEPGFRGVVLANEVLDAMPAHRFCIKGGEPKELFIGWQGEQFVPQWRVPVPTSERVSQRLHELQQKYSLPEGYASELNLAAEDWVHSLATFMEAGVALIIDYGFPQHEFYHPERSQGTLMCHYRHRSHSDPLILLGLQDITTHVDFTAVAEAALVAELGVRGFANQANFLLATGLTEMGGNNESDDADIRGQLEIAAQVKQLTLPSEMGELFKVMALSKKYDVPLQGFMLRDERSRL